MPPSGAGTWAGDHRVSHLYLSDTRQPGVAASQGVTTVNLANRVGYRHGPLVFGVVLLFVPLFDIWRDIVVDGNPVFSTLFENAIILTLCVGLLAASVWLLRSDWDEEYTRVVGRWVVIGTASIALVYGWVLAFQLLIQGRLKVLVVAADGVVIGGLTMFAAGMYSARTRRVNAARAAQHDRFSSLFNNASDAIVGIEADVGVATVTSVNESFEAAFDQPESAFVGRQLDEVAADWVRDTDETASAEELSALVGNPEWELELQIELTKGTCDFLADYVPIDSDATLARDTTGFIVFTDITAQRARERQFETVSGGAESLLEARSMADIKTATRSMAADLFPDADVTVREFDDPTADKGTAGDDAQIEGRIAEEYILGVRRSESFSQSERSLLSLLTTNARAAVARVDRERRLDERNDQLEFVNSLLRHEIQNSLTVIRSRGAELADTADGREARFAETIVEESNQVATLVDRFRSLLNALADDGEIALEQRSLSAVVTERVETVETTYPAASIQQSVPDGIDVVADEALKNVIENVLRNAVDHNDTDEPTVQVTVDRGEHATGSADEVTLQVADDGPGIPDDQKVAVFRRGDRGLKEEAIGSGFGLFFVDQMMERYGGSIDVADNEPRGTVMELTFRTPNAADDNEATGSGDDNHEAANNPATKE